MFCNVEAGLEEGQGVGEGEGGREREVGERAGRGVV